MKLPISFGFFSMFPSIFFPIIWIGFCPLFIAQLLTELKVRINTQFFSLPGRLSGSPAIRLHTIILIFMPWAWQKKTAAVATGDFFHKNFLEKKHLN
ncbi:MAG: hypothetical protein JRI38_02750 [Deltaproteobacteria bacterium]|nr:hypothetical protein [Deltaproteobacteria bacterium]